MAETYEPRIRLRQGYGVTSCADATNWNNGKRELKRNGLDLADGVRRGGRPIIEHSIQRSIRRCDRAVIYALPLFVNRTCIRACRAVAWRVGG
jgi:hypothetical protein